MRAISLIICVFVACVKASPRPHIIFILADDMGWNDVSFHGSDQIQTPNIDALAYNGVILNSHYVLPICTPSRASLMTGLYPIHNGFIIPGPAGTREEIVLCFGSGHRLELQIPQLSVMPRSIRTYVHTSKWWTSLSCKSFSVIVLRPASLMRSMQGTPILSDEPRGLPRGKLLPEYLRELGYTTRALGKWHLGFYQEQFLPTNRGFDSHLGYWNGFVSYYDYIIQSTRQDGMDLNGFDMRRNMTPAYDLAGRYATDMFTDEAIDIIRTHDNSKPLFLYMSHLAVHAGNRGKYVEAPQEEIDRFQHIQDPNRRTYAAMVARMDESVGRVVAALEEAQMLHNSIIVFMSDNGAPTIGQFPNWGSNYPFRGLKETLWEGGVRSPTFLWSPLLKHTPRISNELYHISDWLPTLYAAAGGRQSSLPKLDGYNQWNSISEDLPSERSEILLNIDEVLQSAAIRMNSPRHHWKLVVGTVQNGSYDRYFGQGTNQFPEINPPYDVSAVVNSRACRVLERLAQKHLTKYPTPSFDVLKLRSEATIRCNYKRSNQRACNPADNRREICLYDVKNDPCEMNNLTPFYHNVARYMFKALVQYRQGLVPQLNRRTEPDLANPVYFNGTWSPWRDSSGEPFVSLNRSDFSFDFDPSVRLTDLENFESVL